MENTVVHHISLGRGVVTAQDGKTIRVRFEGEAAGEKSFVYPDAFAKYLRYDDGTMQDSVQAQLDEARAAAQRAAAERAQQRAAAMEAIRTQRREETASKRKSSTARVRKKKPAAPESGTAEE